MYYLLVGKVFSTLKEDILEPFIKKFVIQYLPILGHYHIDLVSKFKFLPSIKRYKIEWKYLEIILETQGIVVLLLRISHLFVSLGILCNQVQGTS